MIARGLAVALALCAAGAARAETPGSARLDALFAEDARAEQALDPAGALARGEPVPHDLLVTLFTPALAERQRAVVAHAQAQLAMIDRSALDPAHRVSYDAFRATLDTEAAALAPAVQALNGVQPFTHFMSFPVEFPDYVGGAAAPRPRNAGDIAERIALERTLPLLFANAEARFREGLASGVVEPRLTVADLIAEIDALLATPPEASLFVAPVRHMPRTIPAAVLARLRRDCLAATTEAVYPAYRRLRAFLAATYLPGARESIGLSALPGGLALYRVLIRQATSLELDPDVVHQTGLGEVARIEHEMAGVARELGATGPLPAFFEQIRSDPRFHPTSPQALDAGFRAVGERVAREAPALFAEVPRTPLVIRPYPAWRARFEAGGSYSEGLPDGSRPGTFWYNTYDWPHRFLSGVTTLYLHEGAPGHHFQISLAAENSALPDFQRFGGNAGYVEGWALYAETLGYAMGLYRDPLQHWGTLDDEMLRAMRLVVDTGIHTRAWTRDQAIAYMLAHSGIGRSDAEAEVDRYIADPGQALAYKVGAMTIQRLRDSARAQLGARFDLRAFHAQVLDSGALPLGVLEAKIDAWIAAQARGSPDAAAR